MPNDFAGRLQASFSQLGLLLPSLLGALVILFAGYLLAKLLERATDRFLRRVRFNAVLRRGGVIPVVERSGSHLNPTRVIANLVFWFVMFVVMLLASSALGLTALSSVLEELIGYIPNVIYAIVIIAVGIVLGGFVGGLILASAGTLHGGPTLARVGRATVIVLAVFMALQELGVATDIVTLAFGILFGAVALAASLAFGLGNRELAGEVTREWYGRYRNERDAIRLAEAQEEAADEAAALAEEQEAEARRTGEGPRFR